LQVAAVVVTTKAVVAVLAVIVPLLALAVEAHLLNRR
jgi:hypothetical protein